MSSFLSILSDYHVLAANILNFLEKNQETESMFNETRGDASRKLAVYRSFYSF